MTKYNWHPLYKYVLQVKKDYFQYLDEAYQQGYITQENYEFGLSCYIFKEWLSSIEHWSMIHYGKPHPCTNIFTPLIITQDCNLCLFKYDKFIKLNDLGYDFNTFFELYDGLYLECRSVVIDIDTMEIVLASQAKFKNLNEDYDWSIGNVLSIMAESDNNYFITEKMDGSNQNFCYNSSKHKIYSSGSQALDPQESWRLKRGRELFKANIGYERLLREFPDTTFMFEFCSPDNPIVVRYTKEQEGLYLFGARDNNTGTEMNPVILFQYADKYKVPHVELYLDEDFDSILKKTADYRCDEKEGWVISIFNDKYPPNNNVFKVKLKVDDYILMHKIITSLVSPNELIKVISSGNYDDFYSKVPESHKELVNKVAQEILFYRNHMLHKANQQYEMCMNETTAFLDSLAETDKQKRMNLMKKKFMILTGEKCDRDVRGICRGWFLNSFFLETPKEIDPLHNCRDEGHGRSYKKIEQIRDWNKKYKKENGIEENDKKEGKENNE